MDTNFNGRLSDESCRVQGFKHLISNVLANNNYLGKRY